METKVILQSLAKDEKHVHNDNNNIETGFSQKEWETALILVNISGERNIPFKYYVGVKMDVNSHGYDDPTRAINVNVDEKPWWFNQPHVRNMVNNNNEVDNVEKCNLKRLTYAMTMPGLHVFNIHRLFASDPRIEKICLDRQNHFIHSRYRSFRFNKGNARSDEELHEKANDFKYLIELCGFPLKVLNLEAYPFSKIMPLINAHCPNVNELILKLKKTESQDFENVFSNMSHLEVLRINWQCEHSSLPFTLVKSLEQVGETLKELCLSRNGNQNDLCLPDSLAFVFPQLITLEKLNLNNFEPSQLLIQSISKIKNLLHLRFNCSWLNNHPVFDKQINMYPIGNLKNLETFFINYDCGVTDEFLINLCNNAKNLTNLHIIGKNITDNGMIALNNLKQLESLKFNLNGLEKNAFITDHSIEFLVYEKLEFLNLSNCTNITNRSVHNLFTNVPKLNTLYVRNTSVTFGVVKETVQITKYHPRPIFVCIFDITQEAKPLKQMYKWDDRIKEAVYRCYNLPFTIYS